MAANSVRSPGSRLSDDLYRLYLMALAWLVFPVYGEAFATILPTSQGVFDWAYPIAAVGVQAGWLWSGARGGPMMISRASVVHELGAPVPAHTVLAPQLLRQAVAWGVGGAMVGGVFTSLGDNFSFSAASSISAAGFLLFYAAVVWAATFMIGVRTTGSARTLYIGASAGAAILLTVTVLIDGTITSAVVLIVLLLVALAGSATAWRALDQAPVQSLWQRSRNLESARSAMLEVDFHRMMVDLRGAGDDKAEGTTRLPSGPWISMWRAVAPIRHALPWSAVRLAMGLTASVLLVTFAPFSEGIVILSFAAVWLVLGYEITRGVAAIAGQVSFLVHYPRSSLPLLAGQLVASLVLGTVLIASSIGWRFAVDTDEAIAATIVAFMGVLAGALQARLGSPDTTSFVERYGLQNAAALLWARALAGPLVAVITAVLAFHGFAAPPDLVVFDSDVAVDLGQLARTLLPALFLMTLVPLLRPLKKVVR